LQLSTWKLHCYDSTVLAVASRDRDTRSTPQLPLATTEADPEKIIKRRSTLQERTSAAELGIYDDFHYPPIATPVVVSHFPITPSIGASRSLNFGSFPSDFSSPSFTTPPPIKVIDFIGRETSIPSSLEAFHPDHEFFPFVPIITPPISPSRTPSPPSFPPVHVQMAGANPPRNMMVEILDARYTPLVLP
jgi:hypothetical protein